MAINILVADELNDIATEFLLEYECRRGLGIEAYFSRDLKVAKEALNHNDYSAVLVNPSAKDPEEGIVPGSELIAYANEKGIPVMIFTDEYMGAMKWKYGMEWGKEYRAFIPKDADFERELRQELKRLLER